MRKIEYIELIQQRVAPGYPNSDLAHLVHPEIVAREIGNLYEDIVYSKYVQIKTKYNLTELDIYTRTFTDIDVQKDENRGVYYVLMPSDIIELPDYAGIRQVYVANSDGDETITFALISSNATGVLGNLPVSKADKLPSLYYEVSMMDGETEATKKMVFDTYNKDYVKVNMKLIIPFHVYNDNDHIPLSPGQKTEILNTVTAIIMGEPPQKQSNNNNDTRV